MIDFKGFKKMSEDKHSVTMSHPKGHMITIHKGSLPALQRKQLERIPLHLAAGGMASDDAESPGQDAPPMDPVQKGLIEGDTPLRAAPLPADDIGVLMQQKQADVVPDAPKAPMMQTAEGSLPQEANTAAPESTQPVAKPTDSGFDINKSYAQGQQAITEQQNVATQLAKQQAALQTRDLQDREALNNQVKQDAVSFQEHQKQLFNDYANGHINPNHYQESMGAGQKVATAIGLLLGGFSGGFNKTGVNPAADFLNKQIERDIESQRAGLDQKKTLLSANQDLYKDQVLATNATRMNMNDIYDHKIQLAAAQLGTPAAKAAADAQHAKFAIENGKLVQESAMRSAALKAASNPNFDSPEQLIHLVPPEHQKEALKEAAQSKIIKHNYEFLMNKYDEAAASAKGGNTLLRSVFGLRTPPAIQAMSALELPLIHDQEGRVNEFEQKTLHDLHPVGGNKDSKNAENRVSYSNFLLNKAQTPTLNAFIPGWSQRPGPTFQSGAQTKTMNGVEYVKVPGGYKRVR